MSSDENTYKHYMLPTRTSIRLIKIQQGSTLDAPLSCSFEVVDLLHNPDYVALSYCWGTPAKTTSVKWDGGSLMVSRTVRDILEAFKETASLLWIDALCINQSDIPERNQQVALMADIYSKATAVNVWLGSDQQEDARPVFESIEALFGGLMRLNAFGEEFEESCDHSPRPPSYSSGYLGAEKSELHWETPDGKVTSIALPKTIMQPNEKQKQRLRTFFDLPWFSRSWILQEVGVAAHATLFWGDSSVEWNAVGVSAVFLTRYAKELLKDCGLVEAVENTRQIYFTFSPFTPLTSFFHLMDKIRPFKATDPRDKVFAILSHPSAKREVYRHVVTEHIRCNESLEILTAAQHDPLCTKLPSPSWVPQWNCSLGTPILGLYTSQYFAAANRRAIVLHSSDNDPDKLVVRGKIISRVTYASRLLDSSCFDLPHPSRPNFASSNATWTTMAETGLGDAYARGDMYPQLPLSYTSDGRAIVRKDDIDIWKACMRTWTAGKMYGDRDDDGYHFESDVYDYWDILSSPFIRAHLRKEAASSTADSSGGSNENHDEYDPGINDHDRWRRAERFRSRVVTVANQRKFFVTKKGLVGLGPGAMRPDKDWIGVLLGADVPFVLRAVGYNAGSKQPFPEDIRFQLVGECYVHGLMQGQAVKGLTEEERGSRAIVLV